MADHPPIVQMPYTLPLENTQWVKKLEILEKSGIIIPSVSP